MVRNDIEFQSFDISQWIRRSQPWCVVDKSTATRTDYYLFTLEQPGPTAASRDLYPPRPNEASSAEDHFFISHMNRGGVAVDFAGEHPAFAIAHAGHVHHAIGDSQLKFVE